MTISIGDSNRKKTHDDMCEKVKLFFSWTFCKHIRFFFRLCEAWPGNFSHLCLDGWLNLQFLSGQKENGRIRREASRSFQERQPATKKGAFQAEADPTPSAFYRGMQKNKSFDHSYL